MPRRQRDSRLLLRATITAASFDLTVYRHPQQPTAEKLVLGSIVPYVLPHGSYKRLTEVSGVNCKIHPIAFARFAYTLLVVKKLVPGPAPLQSQAEQKEKERGSFERKAHQVNKHSSGVANSG